MKADLKFVDDSTLLESFHNVMNSSLSKRGQELANWARTNKMKLNPQKTTELRICFKKEQQHWPPIFIDNDLIQPVKSAKLLGFYINDRLNWDDHVQTIIKKPIKEFTLSE